MVLYFCTIFTDTRRWFPSSSLDGSPHISHILPVSENKATNTQTRKYVWHHLIIDEEVFNSQQFRNSVRGKTLYASAIHKVEIEGNLSFTDIEEHILELQILTALNIPDGYSSPVEAESLTHFIIDYLLEEKLNLKYEIDEVNYHGKIMNEPAAFIFPKKV